MGPRQVRLRRPPEKFVQFFAVRFSNFCPHQSSCRTPCLLSSNYPLPERN
uniref:Uncharacterized protein n=1 Tax=Arundo donax TaxID=35708 RepID=A0A0A9H4U6_ARUDO